jgi:catalase
VRPESFSDHYSQARLFFISQTPQEQKHICDALVFELSKCEREDIRERMVSHLVNIHATLAGRVAEGLGIDVPDAAIAAQPTREDLEPSPTLSIIKRGPKSFEGRKLGILLTDGADADIFEELVTAIEEAGGVYEVIAPKIAGATLSDGQLVAAKQKIDGGPSVLYDAVAILISEEGAALLSVDKPSKDFANDAFAHCKFIGYSDEALPFLQKAGIGDDLDEGCFALSEGVPEFIDALAELRYWPREADVDLDAVA